MAHMVSHIFGKRLALVLVIIEDVVEIGIGAWLWVENQACDSS